MATRNLDKIVRPSSVAVVGASGRAKSVAFTALKNIVDGGFPGEIYPVNPKHRTVQGLKCFARVTELPIAPDLAMICTPARTVPQIVRDCGEAGIQGILILSAGFREASEEGGRTRAANQARGPTVRWDADHRPQLLRLDRATPQVERQLCRKDAEPGQSCLHLAVRRTVHFNSGLGSPRKHRLFTFHFNRKHARCGHWRPD